MAPISEDAVCPACGTAVGSTQSTEGLCPQCLLRLAVRDSDSPSRIVGRRYRILELLGRGGMGDVWRAFDLKLQVDIALKALRPERADDRHARESLRQEVRAAREVVSQNVCRIFDLVVEGHEEFLSMEFIDGTTLADMLEERGPLALQEAREVATQFLAGLEAIHRAGLVHGDFKPENIMITRAGRVAVMDFGLAKGWPQPPTRTALGTPPYMAHEHAVGKAVDPRADVFSAGVVLAEMLTVGGRDIGTARRALWDAVRETPPRVPDSPWAPVLRQALTANVDSRYASARALARALEEVTLQLPGIDERRPYPGLRSFTEGEAEFFFGREFEVEAIWKKLQGPRLMALVGPSGAGKTSFIRAGVLAMLPQEWGAIYCTPDNQPFRALAQTLVPALGGDADAWLGPQRFDDADSARFLVGRWQERHRRVLVVVDQFEELFTLNPPAVRDTFARFLLGLVLDADVRVLLSMRDDFLVHCHEHEALASIFAGLMPLGMPSESSLRRALVQPALACGYRFEDDLLPDQMVKDVSGERSALALLAFAASQMWERRDRQRRLLTSEAYHDIGGVAGALARHAEATLDAIGPHRTPVVREIFRNLVTAEGTRTSRAIDELRSLFGTADQQHAAEDVLHRLVEARLLTTYEAAGDGDRQGQRLEIVHESLLSAWPRLVRWQTQDADTARFRDQLRQAAGLWHARGEPVDLLWSGSAYRDLAVWREHYPGALSNIEEAFAEASARRASRQITRRRLAASILFTTAVGVATLTSILWLTSEASRRRAESEAKRAEASKLLALGQIELATFPTAALAYALKSLELADSEVGRLFALRALQTAPPATLTPLRPVGESGIRSFAPAFSPNGEWFALGGFQKVQVFNRQGRTPVVLGDYPPGAIPIDVGFGPRSDVLVGNKVGRIRVWSFPDGRELRREVLEQGQPRLVMRESGFLTLARAGLASQYRLWPFGPGEPRVIGTWEGRTAFDGSDEGPLVYSSGPRIYQRSLDGQSAPLLVAEASASIGPLTVSHSSRRIAAIEPSGAIRVWSVQSPMSSRVIAAKGARMIRFDPAGATLAAIVADGDGQSSARIWNLNAPPGAEPIVLRRSGQFAQPFALAFDPSGQWLVTTHGGDAAFWPMAGDKARVLTGHRGPVSAVAFAPDGRLLSGSTDGTVRWWPLSGADNAEGGVLLRHDFQFIQNIAIDSESRRAAFADGFGRVVVMSLTGQVVREFDGLPAGMSSMVAFGDHGRLLAAAPYAGRLEQRVIRVWNVETGAVRILPPVPHLFDGTEWGFDDVLFSDPDHVIASVGRKGLVIYDLTRDTGQALPGPSGRLALSGDGRFGVGVSVDPEAAPGAATSVMRFDVGSGRPAATIGSYGNQSATPALNPSGTLMATTSVDGTVRIGPVSGGEPHLFFGHTRWPRTLAFSPDGRWVASGGDDGTIRLWPVPDFSRPPLQTRKYEELLTVLRSHTNLRVVPDPQSSTGWKVDRLPFPGWSRLPED